MAALTYPCYHQYKDNARQWRWTYYARNAKVIGVASEAYINRADCTAAINLMRGSSGDPLFYTE